MVVIGLIPAMAAGREALRGRSEGRARLGLLLYFLRRISRSRRLAVHIDPSNDDARIERVQSVAVTCNAFEEGFGRFLARGALDAGELTVYQLRHLRVTDMLRLAVKMFFGRWQHDEALNILKGPALTIRSHKARLQVMLDGEIQSMTVPLEFRIKPQTLRVLSLSSKSDTGH
jgi:diacylglycerol kinase family enzyme